ncbi:ABC transporter permease [Candidatus Nitrosacidococcus tergens]|uniref:ABC transporter permease n=1 Tax=Candidatus Nitrosacidococcus tergens TaxID=553981 RepID=UPI0018D5B881|nr:ABC transporter permease [Candidatus Nitrosacidococcus tergens]
MWLNALLLAWREIRRNLMRSFLTILGIIIGVASVITMVTLGNGATLKITNQIASLGSNLLILRPGQRRHASNATTAPAFTLRDQEALNREMDSIRAISGSASDAVIAIYSNHNWATTINGVDENYFTVRNWHLVSGRNFLESEFHGGKGVCILGATVQDQLFDDQDSLGKYIRLKKLSCQVIGILEAKGQTMMGMDQDDTILIPLRTFQRRIIGNQDIGIIQISLQNGVSEQKAKEEITQIMRKRRHISPSDREDFSVLDMKEITQMLTGTTQIMTTLLGAVAAVSLLVGGIGIMNIMLVSVTERTREIGIRLAIGALEREVLLQFLVEAVVLSSLGGLIGVGLALITSLGLSTLLQIPFILKPGIMSIAFLFSSGVGIVFGYFPARKAAMLDPMEALRHE